MRTRSLGALLPVVLAASCAPAGSGLEQASLATLAIHPVLECVVDEPGGYRAWFGYLNDNDEVVAIPVGADNRFTPLPEDRGQTTEFLPGRVRGAFSVPFTTGNQVWTLAGPDGGRRTSTASPTSARCGASRTWYRDADGDGHGDAAVTATAVFAPSGYVSSDDDCDDADAARHPGATEVCDGIDGDCDGVVESEAPALLGERAPDRSGSDFSTPSIHGDYAVTTSAWLYVHDVAGTDPVELSVTPAPSGGFLWSATASEWPFVLAAAQTGGLVVYDASVPSAPVMVAHVRSDLQLFSVTVADGVAYCAGVTGLHIFDVSTPSTPVYLSSLADSLTVPSYNVAVSGHRAYLASYTRGLSVVDVASPAAPTRIGFFASPDMYDVEVSSGGRVITTGLASGARIFEISPSGAPSLVGTVLLPGSSTGVAETEPGVAIVASGGGRLSFIAVDGTPTFLGQVDRPYANLGGVAVQPSSGRIFVSGFDVAPTGRGRLLASYSSGCGTFCDSTADAAPSFSPTGAVAASPHPAHAAIGDATRDRLQDVAVTLWASRAVDVYPGTAAGGLGSPVRYTYAGYTSHVALAPTVDSSLDLVATHGGNIAVRRPLGGSFGPIVKDIAIGSEATRFVIDQLGASNYPDAAVIDEPANEIVIVHDLAAPATATWTARYAVGVGPSGIGAGDLNEDGWNDLAVVTSSDRTLDVLLGSASGAFTRLVPTSLIVRPRDLVLGRFDCDAHLDIAYPDDVGGGVYVRLGRGDGTFGAATLFTTPGTTARLALGDVNRDGVLDFVALDQGVGAYLLTGDGDGLFTNQGLVAAGTAPFSLVAVGDLSADGRPDVLLGALTTIQRFVQ